MGVKNTDEKEKTHSIVPAHLVVKAMRDSGYKNAAYAVAELMDNSIQADAKKVDLLCGEKEQYLSNRSRMRLHEIAVLDNGHGMDADILRMALQFGGGTHLEPEQWDGMGRFGMGLPNSSISQCKKVDVWSWKEGIENALHSFLDVDQIEAGRMVEIPEPRPKTVPPIWLEVGSPPGETGTLVVWSKIDRCMWKTGDAIIRNSELIIGRIYRRFLMDGDVEIRMVPFDIENPSTVKAKYALPNDPLYLMSPTSCPDPWSDEPMFQEWGESYEPSIRFNGEEHQVRINFSYAKEEARVGHNPGAKPFGRHAAKNIGVSLIRADRELDLDPRWSSPSEPRDRWWGVEVDFPPALDDLFGVTNNKQSARYFSELANKDLESLLEEGQTLGAAKDKLIADEDPSLPLLEIANHIQKNVNSIRELLKAQTKGKQKGKKRHNGKSTEEIATEATEERKAKGFSGESDQQEDLPKGERQQDIVDVLIEQGVTQEDAEELAATTVDHGLKYAFATASISSTAFFDVKSRGGSLIVTLNSSHPAYSNLVEVLEDELEEEDSDTLSERLIRAKDGLELILMAWARYEDEQPDGSRRDQVQDARWDWGRLARDFLRGGE